MCITGFFPSIVSVDQKPFFVFILLSAPQRTTYKEVPSQVAVHLKMGSPLQAGDYSLVSLTMGLTNLTLDMVSHSSQNSTKPWIDWVGRVLLVVTDLIQG